MNIGPRSRRADGGIREFWVSLHDGAGDELSYPRYERVLVVWSDGKWRHGAGTVDEYPVSFVPVITRCHDAEAFGISTTARGEPEFLMTLNTPISLDWDQAGIAITPQVVHPSTVYDVLRWLRVPKKPPKKRRPTQKRKK